MNENKKIIIISMITIVLVGMLVCIMVIDIPFLGISSIKSIIGIHEELISKGNELVSKQSSYKQSLSKLENIKQSYQNEKTKYEAISDETINIIKESNTEDNYSLEYMWIKLGNYARKNNLTLVMVEPGNNNSTTSTSNDETKDQSVVEETTSSSIKTSKSNVLKIQVTGNYINLSDFVFEVENDEELKFKLDNISMEYVSGTTIKTTFDVKNIIITK